VRRVCRFSFADARGVGSSGEPGCCGVLGVVGEEEEAFALVCGADVGRGYNHPFRIEPEAGKVGEHGVEAESKVPCDVLKDRVPGS
jgi:hypothetical protein